MNPLQLLHAKWDGPIPRRDVEYAKAQSAGLTYRQMQIGRAKAHIRAHRAKLAELRAVRLQQEAYARLRAGDAYADELAAETRRLQEPHRRYALDALHRWQMFLRALEAGE